MLSGLKILVTGASSGIGQSSAKVLAAHGAEVFGTGRNVSALESSEYLKGFHVCDLTESGAAEAAVEAAVSEMQGLTTVVNAAGVLQGGAMGSVGLENFHYNMTANVQAVFEVMQHSIPHLRSQKDMSPSIVNIRSVNGKQAFAGCATYCASKAAVDQLSRCASLDLAPDNIRVNVVNPGVVETPLQRRGGMDDDAYANFLDRSINVTHPLGSALGRVAQPQEVGELISFLVSKNAKFITGECIAIDGGRQNLGAR